MKQTTLGSSDIKLSAIAMGLWQAGKRYWAGVKDQEVSAAIRHAINSGITTFDTAEEYGDGYSESLLGKAIKEKRDDLIIMTKAFSNHLAYNDVITACERSLKNLETDYIDLYQVHWPSGSWGSKPVPLEETLRAFEDLKKQGKIRAIGVSNFSLEQLKQACELVQIDSLQSPYSLFWRHLELEIIPYCQKNNITVLAYSPLAQGFLTGKFKKGHTFEKGDNRKGNKLFAEDIFEKVLSCNESLEKIAERKNATLAQIALAWIIQHENILAIAGARNSKQIVDSAKASEVFLSKEDICELTSITEPISSKFMNDPLPWNWKP